MAAGCAWGPKRRMAESDGDAGEEQKPLHHVSPDDGAKTTNEGVEDGDDAEAHDERDDRPAGEAGNGEREQIEDEAHLGKVACGKGEGRVHADAGAEALAEIFIDRHGDGVAEERHDDGADGPDDRDKKQVGNEQIPVAGVGRAWEGDEGEAGDDGREQRETGSPAGHGAAGDKVGVGGFLAAAKRRPQCRREWRDRRR